MSHDQSVEKDVPHVEVQWAVDMGFAVVRARDEDHARQWVKGYEDNPDAVTEGDPMPVVVRRTVTKTPWTRPIPPAVADALALGQAEGEAEARRTLADADSARRFGYTRVTPPVMEAPMSEAPDLREQEDCPSPEACDQSCDQHPEKDALTRAKETAYWDAAQGYGTSCSPDERTVPGLLAGILDALIAVAERLPDTRPIPPGKSDSPTEQGDRP